MQPQAQQLTSPSPQPFPSGTLDSRADTVTQVAHCMGHHELRDDAHPSSSTTVPNDNAADDTCNDVPVLDAQLDAGSSRHGQGTVAQVVRPSCRMKHDTSTTPSKAECNPVPSSKCFTKDENPEPPGAGSSSDYFLDEETERWDQRQQKTGAVGRLVSYRIGQSPKEDIFLRGGGRHHIILSGLRDGGLAARTGVKVGDRLVSIDGKKDLLGLQAEAIQECLKAPAVLVFLGFVGKLEAEVRIPYEEQVFGISSRQEAVKGMDSASVQLCEERVFKVGRAPLFLAVMPKGVEVEQEEEQDEEEDVVKGEENHTVTWRTTPGHSTSSTKQVLEVATCFELQRSDAHRLVRHALQAIENGTLSEDDSCRSAGKITSFFTA